MPNQGKKTRKEIQELKRNSLQPKQPPPRSPTASPRLSRNVQQSPRLPRKLPGIPVSPTKTIEEPTYELADNMEQSICQVYASVMLYDDGRRQWMPSGGAPGMARVHIYQHQSNNTYRVVGRLMADQSVVINCAILKGLKYNQATATFHQWRDSRQVYGLNFQSADDAAKFAGSMMDSLDSLQQQAAPAPPRPSPPQPQPPVHHVNHNGPAAEDHRIRQEINSHPMQSTGPPRSSVPEPPSAPPAPPVPQTPAAPPAPPVPQAPPSPPNSAPPPPGAPPAAPPAPPGPPPPPGGAGGGPPPPPPPPPPPGSGGSGGGGGGGGNDLAAQLAAAKLKKAAPKEDEPKPRAGGPGGVNMMADLQRRLKERQKRSEGGDSKPAASKEKVSPPEPKTEPKRPWENKAPAVNNRFGNTNGTPGSPKIGRRGSVNNNQNGGVTSPENIDFDRMKQEIMVEMRKEISKMKEDIIEAIKMELNRR